MTTTPSKALVPVTLLCGAVCSFALAGSPAQKVVAADNGGVLTTDAAVPVATHGSGLCGGKTFPNLNGKAPRYEWMPVVPGGYETTAAGIALAPHVVHGLLPFSHPFGLAPNGKLPLSDTLFSLAVGARYTGLLNASNISRRGQVPGSAGLLGVGFDQGLLPRAYLPATGDSVVILGDWVVNCGQRDFHTEIRPPLLLATASRARSAAAGPDTTVSSIVGRPYLVDQEYREDAAVSKHGFIAHLDDELTHWAKTLFRSKIAALAHVRAKPFSGRRTLIYSVSPPTPRRSRADKLIVSYNLTVRGGVSAQVSVPANEPNRAQVVVRLSEVAYQSPRLPKAHKCTYKLKQLGFDAVALKLELLHLFSLVGVPNSFFALTLDPEIAATCYQPLPPLPFAMPSGRVIRVDDGQPYPIHGVITARWERHAPADVVGGTTPAVSIGDTQVAEGNSGLTAVQVPVALSAPPAHAVTVRWATRDGSAQAPSDYLAATGELTFPAGVTRGVVTVNVVGDTAVEPDEGFAVDLSGPVGATISKSAGVVAIINDDHATAPPTVVPTLSIGDVSLAEGNSATRDATFAVTLSSARASAVEVDYRTQDGSADGGDDYEPREGTLTIPAGQLGGEIRVPVIGDTDVEPDEKFSVMLDDPVNATTADGKGVATILNDDVAPAGKPDLVVSGLQSTSGESLTFCTVQFTITNQGSGPAGGSVTNVHGHAGVAGNWSTNVDTPAVAAGESVTLSGTLDHACHNTDVTVTADTTSVVDESDEDNNVDGKVF